MAEEVIIDVKVPDSEVKQAIKSISQMRGKVEQLKEENKNLDKSSSAYTKNALKIKELNTEIRTNERVLTANKQAQSAAEGSIQQLRKQLSVVSQQWADLSEEERNNTEAGQALTEQKTKLTEKLKEEEKATGDNRRNVGNYSEGMKEALQQSDLFTKSQAGLVTIQKSYRAVTGGAITATRAFKVALASTGIGAIVIAFGSLIAYLTQTQKGMDLVNQVMDGAKAIFQVLIDRLLGFGAGLKSIFVDGNFSEGIDQLKSSFKGMGEEIANESQAAATLRKELQSIEKQESRLEVKRAKARADIASLKRIAEDTEKGAEERAEAAEKAMQMEQDLLNETIKLQEEKLEATRKQNEMGTITEEDLQKERDIEIELAGLKQESTEKQIELNNKLNTIRDQATREEKARINKLAAARDKKAKEREAREEKQAQEVIEREQEKLEESLENIRINATEEVNALKQSLLNKKISREEYEEEVRNLELAGLEARKAIYEDDAEKQAEIEQKILDLKIDSFKKKQALANKEQQNEKANKEAQQQMEKQAANARLQLAQDVSGTVASFFGEETIAYKILSSAQAAITTYSNATKAYQSQMSIPTPDAPVRAAIAAGAAIAQGLAQVAKINSVEVPKFASGVIGLDGPGTETSDSIPARLSKSESVMTAKATKRYAPVLAAMEQSVGNQANFRFGKGRFSSGVVDVSEGQAASTTRQIASERTNISSQLQKQPIFVSVTELERERGKRQSAERFTELKG